MTSTNYLEIFRALSAEATLVLTAAVALTLDLAVWREAAPLHRHRRLGIVAIVGLLAAAVALCQQLGAEPVRLLGGSVVVSDLTLVFKLVIVGLTIVTTVISMESDLCGHVGEYFAMLLFGATGMLWLVGTEELVTIFVALELTSICLYVLTAFHKGALRSQEAAVKYFMFGAISSAFLLFGLSYLYGATGTTDLLWFRQTVGKVAPIGTRTLLGVGLLFVVIGFGFKVAVVPFHLWAPDAYEGAPTPVTAFIATGSKVASFFVLAKVMMIGFASMQGTAFWGGFASGWTMLLAVTALASMVLGNFAAIVQHNVKRLLAYSSIAHAGYILIGLIAATRMGAASLLFYLLVYSIANLGAFGVVAALAARAGGEEMRHFNGMARRAPLLSLLMLIFVLSLAGIPPLGGFFGKFYLFAAALQGEAQTFGLLWLVVAGILTSAVSLYYYLVLLKHMYVHEPTVSDRIGTPTYLNATLIMLALGVIALGLFPEPILTLLNSLLGAL